jgi:hypothetical protein
MGNPAKVCLFALLFSCLCVSTANAQQYSPTDLYTLERTTFDIFGGFDIESASGGQVAGAQADIGPVFWEALLWSGPSGAAASLSPGGGGIFSRVNATDGVQQVGYTYGVLGNNNHAVIWNGTASPTIDLHPTKLLGVHSSEAFGMGGGQQVGFASTNDTAPGGHAVVWQGTADSVVDLHPTNLTSFSESFAYGTDGVRQVGMAGSERSIYGLGNTHAILWSGTADSAIDLHPLSGFDTSKAVAINGMQQVGSASGPDTGGGEHAMLWLGSAASAVDLNPTLLAYIDSSTAQGTNGTVQVGWGVNASDLNTALLWRGTSDSAIDLGALLPANLINSRAFSVDADGTVWGVAVEAGGAIHAVEWTLVPEPATVILAAIAVWSFGLCRFRGALTSFVARVSRQTARLVSQVPPRHA